LGLHYEGTVLPLLSSLEGDGEDAWPPSPPLQQLSLEGARAGHQAALLIGMAGRSHWSLSVVKIADEPGSLEFDVACRANQSPLRLGSSYHTRIPASADRSGVVLQAAPIPVRISADAGLDGTRCEIAVCEGRLTIVSTPDARPMPATYRWKYHVRPA